MTHHETNQENDTNKAFSHTIGSQSFIDRYTQHREHLKDQLHEAENRPGGFKLDAVEIFKKHREQIRAKNQLKEVDADWKTNGGDAIDEAQETVNKLNFRSNATDHIYAKAALRDAKNKFFENKANEELLLEAPETPLLEDGVDTNTSKPSEDINEGSPTSEPEDSPENSTSEGSEQADNTSADIELGESDHNDKAVKSLASHGLTQEEFLALKALNKTHSVESLPEEYPDLKPKNAENNVDMNEFNNEIDELSEAVDAFYDAEGDELIDELGEAVDESRGETESPSPTPEEESDSERIKSNIKAVRSKANISRAHKAVREGFKSHINDVNDKIDHGRLKANSFFGRLLGKFNRNRRKPLEYQGVTRYSDGQFAIIFGDKGVTFPIGFDGKREYTKRFGHEDAAIIMTKSGKRFGIANGLVIDKATGHTYPLPETSIEAEVGKSITLPGIGKTDPVLSIELQYNGDPDTLKTEEDRWIRSTDTNPFSPYIDLATNKKIVS